MFTGSFLLGLPVPFQSDPAAGTSAVNRLERDFVKLLGLQTIG